MTDALFHPPGIGDHLPEIDLRTDEGTPVALLDFEGRAIAVFLAGDPDTTWPIPLLNGVKERVREFHRLGVSPLVVLRTRVETLRELRIRDRLPFILLADEDGTLHRLLDTERTGAWLADAAGKLVDVVPALTPSDVIEATLASAARLQRNDAEDA